MADWRARNEVPDSDEEDGDEISQNLHETGGATVNRQENQRCLQSEQRSSSQTRDQSHDVLQNEEEEAQRLTKDEDRHDSETSHSDELGFSMDLDDSEDELALPAPRGLISKQQPIVSLSRLFSSDGPLHQEPGDSEQAPKSTREERSLSSDLSSLSSLSPPGSPQIAGATCREAIARKPNEPVVLIERPNVQPEASDRASRRFRQRKAIQLNPYAIEGQQYRDTLKSRGLKPINIQQFSQPKIRGPAKIDAQRSDNESFTSEPADAQTPSSSPHHNEESQTLFTFPSSPPTNQDEFPDVNALLREPLGGTIHDGFKRRKITHTYTKRPGLSEDVQKKRRRLSSAQNSGTFRIPRGVTGSVHFEGNVHTQHRQIPAERSSDAATVFDGSANSRCLPYIPNDSALPSPVPTDRSQPFDASDDYPGIELEPSLTTPPQLHTPATSSEQKRDSHASAKVQILVDSESDLGAEDRVQTISDEASDGSSEVERHRELMRAQRRTRGVLPASWHRLSYRDQKEKVVKSQRPRRLSLLSPAISPRKGVARPISSSSKPLRTDPGSDGYLMSAVGIDEDSETQSEQDSNLSRKLQQSIEPFLEPENIQTIELISSDDEEHMELDSVDAMLASRPRSSTGTRKRQKTRQPRITDVLRISNNLPKESVVQKERSSRRPTTTKPLKHGKRSKGRKLEGMRSRATKRHEQMSILDVADISNRATTPNFIMIASRTAKQRVNKGRHSPTKKVFQMQNREDTDAVRESLVKWKRGDVLHRKQIHSRRPREPLTERTPNNTLIFTSDRDLESPRSSEENVTHLARPHPSSVHFNYGMSASHAEVPGEDQGPLLKSRGPANSGRMALGQITSSVNPARSYVPAQLETQRHRSGRAYTRRKLPKDLLERYLEESPATPTGTSSLARTGFQIEKPTVVRSRRRKRTPRQATPETFHLPNEDLFLNTEDVHTQVTSTEQLRNDSPPRKDSDVLRGLARFGTGYTSTFNVEYLPDGALFDDSTFLGSGGYARCLPPYTSPLDGPISQSGTTSSKLHWTNWNETVSEQIRKSLGQVTQCLQNLAPELNHVLKEEEDSIHSLDSITRYLSTDLRFLDPIDRRVLVDRLYGWLLIAVNALQEALSTKIFKADSRRVAVSISARILVLIHQVKGIASNELIPQGCRTDAATLFVNALRQAVRAVFQNGCVDFSMFTHETVRFSYHISRQTAKASVEAFVIIRHTLEYVDPTKAIWDLLQAEGVFHLQDNEYDVQVMDRVWRRVFCLLPYFDIDVRGRVQRQSLHVPRPANWKLINNLTKPILDCRLDGSTRPGSTFNEYCRAIFSRCLHLIQYWRWLDCEVIITHLFDFFARNNLGDLPLEDNRGSPLFLERFTDQSILRLESQDRCFQIFLKIIGIGLRALRLVSSNKRIRNSVFRLTPNHGRRLPKDQEIRHPELDAVRNHFDLLCTLYWAAPPAYRPRLSVIQNLLDVEESHRQACHLVIRSWSCLIHYQLSTPEPVSALDPFVNWYGSILEKIIDLHKLARTEVENDAKVAERTLGQLVSQDTRENVIANSQRHIEAIIMDALHSLKRAIERATTSAAFVKLLSSGLAKVLSLFDPKHPRVNKVVVSVLQVIQTYATRSQIFDESEDSQGFGDWSAFQDLDPGIGSLGPITVDPDIYKALRNLLSDAFGSDDQADDDVLQSMVETWLAVARLEVRAGNKSWDNYVSAYGQDSWKVIRSTEQTRRFTPFFFATLVESEDGAPDSCKDLVFREWAASLVERESLIKFQPLFTASLLNHHAAEPLLDNPPFRQHRDGDKFQISITDFSDQRLSLLSRFLSNMRESVNVMTYHSLPERANTTRSYTAILQNLMNTMKTNYQGLGEGSDIQGAYVSFVQEAVELLQQHTADICKVDPFFTDASNFPLPDHDPEYIVGSLKNLGLRLDLPGGLQKLCSFLQTLCERSAIEDKQQYYSSLLQAAMEETLDLRTPDKPALCSSIFKVVFPIYADSALSSPCGWFAATPVLLALPLILDSLLFHTNSFHQPSLQTAESILFSVLHGIHNSCTTFLSNPQLLQQPYAYRVLTYYLTILISTLEPLEHLFHVQNAPSKAGLLIILQNLRDFTLFLLGFDIHEDEAVPFPTTTSLDLASPPPLLPASLRPAQSFARDQLRDSLDPASRRCKWKVDAQGRHFFLRSGRWEELRVKLGSYAEEKGMFVERVKEFVGRVERIGGGLGIRKAGVRIEVERRGGDMESMADVGLDEVFF